MFFDVLYVGCQRFNRVWEPLTADGHTLRRSAEVNTVREFYSAFSSAAQNSHVIVTVGSTKLVNTAALITSALGMPDEEEPGSFPASAAVYSEGGQGEFGVLAQGNQCIVMIPSEHSDIGDACDFIRKKYEKTQAATASSGEWSTEELAAVGAVSVSSSGQITRENISSVSSSAPVGAGAITVTELSTDTAEVPTVQFEEVSAISDADLLDADRARKKKKTRKRLRSIFLTAALALTLAVSLIAGYFVMYIPVHCDSVYSTARSLYGSAGSGAMPNEMLSKFGALYDVNKDVSGWLIFSNTNINYPVVRLSKEKGEEYYASHLYNGDSSKYGSLWFDEDYRFGEYNRNTVITGNNTNDGRMLSDLELYTDIEHYAGSPVISMDTVYAAAYWKIFAVMIVDPKEVGFDVTRNTFFDDSAFSSFIDQAKARSLIDTTVDVTGSDEVLTVITRYSPDRSYCFAVMARKVRSLESISVDVSGVRPNEDAVYPESWTGDRLDIESLTSEQMNSIINIGEDDVFDPDDVSSTGGIPAGVDKDQLYESDVQYYDDEENFGMNDDDEDFDDDEEEEEASSNVSSKPVSSAKPSSKPETSSGAETSSTDTSGNATTSQTSSGQSTSSAVSSAPVSSLPPVSSSTDPKDVYIAPNAAACAAPLTVYNSTLKKVETDIAVNIIARIVEAEMGSGFEIEALKAQAVAAYTYLKYHGTSEKNPVSAPMKNTPSQKVLEACQAVVGQTVTYQNKICLTTYYAYSAGYTNACDDVWSATLPYLVSVDSSVDKQYSKFETTKTFTSEQVKSKIKSKLGITLSGNPDEWFQIVAYTSSGVYVGAMRVGGELTYKSGSTKKAITGATMRSIFSLRSAAFTIEYDQSADTFTFHVYGYGHGVGMSQRGANYYAAAGYSYQWILRHYYVGVTIKTDSDFE